MTNGRVQDQRAVRIPPYGLGGDLCIPSDAAGLVIFAHGSGSSRHSSRNHMVSEELNRGGLATLLMDLLSEDEDRLDRQTAHLRFDIPMLAGRLANAAEWASEERGIAHLPRGYFGASTGGGAALVAAALEPSAVRAVVSRGGRPDLAGEALPKVAAPTLLIVGGLDDIVVGMNETAMRSLRCVKRLEVIPGATHLFEEPGALEHVADLAKRWFLAWLPGHD